MSHYLKTINEEAAVEPTAAAVDLPGIGETVIFFPRPGELRAGRGRHAAIVTGQNDDGTLDVVVIYDADDLVGCRRLARRSLDGGMGWEPVRQRQAEAADPMVVSQLLDRVQQLTDRINALTHHVFGDYEIPKEPLLDVLDEHEQRLEAVEKAAIKAAKPAAASAAKRNPAKGAKRK